MKMFKSPTVVATALALAGLASFAGTGAAAQTQPAVTASAPPVSPPSARPLAPPAPTMQAQQTVDGKLRQWLVNPNGEVDGLLLDDGTQVAFPPHLSAQLTQALKPKDALRISGFRGADGAAVLRAASITNTANGRVVTDQPPAAGIAPPAPRPAGTLTAMDADGRIARVLRGPMGEANGALLDGGTVVRFPPHVGADLAANLKVGGNLYARGYGTRNDYGSALEATRIGTTLASAKDVFGPPPPSDRGALPAPGAMPPPPGAMPPPPAVDGAPR